MAQPKVKIRFEVEGEGTAKQALRSTAQEAETAADRIDKKMTSLGNTLKALGIGTIIGQGLGFVIKQAMEAERIGAQLEARLKSTGGAAGVSRSQLEAFAESLQRTTTFGDDAILEMQTLLLTFTQIRGPKVADATKAILDISTAMGTDLKGAAIQVGKALNDPIKGVSALAEVGVSFTEAQKKVIRELVETGRVAEAQGIILKELSVEFGGAAEAARDTFGGALEALGNTLSDLVEGGSGSLNGAKAALEDLNTTLNDPAMQEGFAKMVSGLIWVMENAIKATAAVGGLAGAVQQALFRDNQTRTEDGLLERRRVVADDITRLQGGLLDKASMALGGESGVNPFVSPNESVKKLQAELALIDERLERLFYLKKFNSGASAVDFGPDTFAPDGQITISAGEGFGKGKGADRSAAAAAKRAAEAALRALREQEQAAKDYHETLLDLEATVGGDLAEATRRYEVELAALNEQAAKGKVAAEEQTRAQKSLLMLHQREVAEIERRNNPAKQLIEDMQFELDLMTMTNAEREVAIRLRQLEGKATAEQIEQIRGLVQASENMERVTGEMDQFRGTFQDVFADIITGSESAAEGIKRLGDAFAAQIARMIAEWASAQLFGAPGQSGGGVLGGVLGSIFGIFGGGGGANPPVPSLPGPFGGLGALGFAEGGKPPVGSPYWVGERGPELRIDHTPGTIVPMHKLGGGSNRTYNLTFNVPGATRETAGQLGQKVVQALRMAQRDS